MAETVGQINDNACLEDQAMVDDQDNCTEGNILKKRNKKQSNKDVNKAEKCGVCYLSRVPPHMNPSHIRQMLSNFGDIGRIYLALGESTNQVQRKQVGGLRAKQFSEGWVEFTKKSVAKQVAKLFNGEQIGGRRRSAFYYDRWNIKYLRKFKWDDLTSEIGNRNRIREQKLNMEISAAKRERDFYLSKVEQSRAMKFIQERRKKKQKTEGAESIDMLEPRIVRSVSQKQPVSDGSAQSKLKLSNDILAGVFGASS